MTPTKADLRIQQSILDGLAADGIRPHMIVKKGIASADTVSRWQETAKESRRMTLAEAVALADAYGYDKVFGAFAADAGFVIRATTEDEAEADLEDAAVDAVDHTARTLHLVHAAASPSSAGGRRRTPEERVEIAKAAREGAKKLTVVAKVALRGAR